MTTRVDTLMNTGVFSPQAGKYRLITILHLLLIAALVLSGCAQATATPTDVPATASAPLPTAATATVGGVGNYKELVPAAQSFVGQLASGDFEAAVSSFDPTMKSAMPSAKLKDTWTQLLGQTGAFQKQLGIKTLDQKGYRIVFVTCQFEKATIDVQVTYDILGRIAGLFFKPGQAVQSTAQVSGATPQAYAAPAYVKMEAFKESEVTIGSGEWALPGTLTMPVGNGPFAVVVLVHGSGPNDRDESIGPNKPFRDLAWGLASQGIAVLRYDKRTKVHAAQFTPDIVAKLTLKEETIDDALLAAQLLRQTQGIDPKRIYVLGHSLGATAAPRIGQQDPALAGLIVMAGMAIPFEDEVLRQYEYLYGLQGALTDVQKSEIEALKVKVARVKDPSLNAQTPASDLPLNVPAAYWLDLRGYQPAEMAKGLAMPVLVLQGERDYQVTPDQDYGRWKTALAAKSNAVLKLYPKLNHLFIAGEGQPSPQEYSTAGHVSADVIADIVQWVKKN